MRSYPLSLAAVFAAAMLAACSGGGSSPSAPIGTHTATPTAAPTAAPTAQPQVVRVGFGHLAVTDPTYGLVQYYSTGSTASSAANVVTVTHGSQVVFLNDGSGAPHTASGLGSSGFPGSFDNTGGATLTGTTIDGGTTWSTGTLNEGSTSAAFTVGPAGVYYFGCFYHYDSSTMRDVIVSQ